MRIIEPKVELIMQQPGIEGMYKNIELAGRACYASQHHIGEDTAKPFAEMLKRRGHTSCLEHGAVYLQMPYSKRWYNLFRRNPYSRVFWLKETGSLFISTNYRVLYENEIEDLLYFAVEPGGYHTMRITARFYCQIAISREFNRHRVDSIAEQSTRYCSYDKERFGGEIKICLPEWLKDSEIEINERKEKLHHANIDNALFRKYCTLIATLSDSNMDAIDYWLFANLAAEYSYMKLKELGWKAEQARTVLPLDTATDLVHTAFLDDWLHFFDLRCDKDHAHPDAYRLATDLRRQFIDNNIITLKK